jgi:hypothetical protein
MFKIEFCGHDGKHVELKHDGTIELFIDAATQLSAECVKLDYRQSSILKAMILANDALEREARR